MTSIDADELRLLRDSAEGLARQHASAGKVRRRRDHSVEFDAATMAALADAGFLGIAIAEAHGGLGLSLDHWTAVAEAFGKTLLTEPFVASSVFASRVIAGGDNESLKAQLLPQIAQGQCVATVACDERPDAIAWDRCKTRAVADDAGATITGAKRFVRPGAGFDGVVVSAMADNRLGLYWVTADAPGLSIVRQRLSDGGHSAELRFDGVHVAKSAIVQAPGTGAATLTAAADEAVIVSCAELLGMIRQMLAMTLDYLRIRHQFGKPIGSFQALQHRAVNLYIQQELADVALADALQVFRCESDPRARSLAASRAKSRCADAALLIGKEAIQMHGAIGYTDEHDVGLYMKRAIVQSSWLGNAAQHRRRYASL